MKCEMCGESDIYNPDADPHNPVAKTLNIEDANFLAVLCPECAREIMAKVSAHSFSGVIHRCRIKLDMVRESVKGTACANFDVAEDRIDSYCQAIQTAEIGLNQFVSQLFESKRRGGSNRD